jgi:hypothetical protein
LKQQKSMAHVFAVKETSRNASQIIECRGSAIGGWRRQGQCFKRAFSRRYSRSLSEGSSGGDEKGAHEERESFSVASRFSVASTSRRRVAFHTRMILQVCSWGTFPDEMSCCWIRVATCAAELIT